MLVLKIYLHIIVFCFSFAITYWAIGKFKFRKNKRINLKKLTVAPLVPTDVKKYELNPDSLGTLKEKVRYMKEMNAERAAFLDKTLQGIHIKGKFKDMLPFSKQEIADGEHKMYIAELTPPYESDCLHKVVSDCHKQSGTY